MKKNIMIDAISNIDGDLIEKYFKTEEKLQKNKAKKHTVAYIMRSAMAACLVLALCAAAARDIASYIPAEYDLEYFVYISSGEIENGGLPQYGGTGGVDSIVSKENVWVYYVRENIIKRERVRLPCGAENVFIVWKYLNDISEDAEIISCDTVESEDMDGFPEEKHFVLNIVVSADLADNAEREDYDLLILSLKKTISEYTRVKADEINVIFK